MSDRRARAALAASALLCAVVAAGSASGGVDARDLFSSPTLHQVELSPSGALLATLTRERGYARVRVSRVGDAESALAHEQLNPVRRIEWVDDRHLVVYVGWQGTGHRVVTVWPEGDGIATELRRIPVRGQLVSLLPGRRGEVLWSVSSMTSVETVVYRAPIADLLEAPNEAVPATRGVSRVAAFDGRVDVWGADPHGAVRAALVVEGARFTLWVRRSETSEWRAIVEADLEEGDDFPVPVGFAEDGCAVIVIARVEDEPSALYEIDCETGELGDVLLARSDADVTGAIFDDTGTRVIGATFDREGLPASAYFDSFNDRYQRSLEASFPGMAVSLLGASRDRRRLLVLTLGAREPGAYYVVDTERKEALPVGRVMPWLDPDDLADSVVVRAAASDGPEVEAFLTRSERAGPRPPLVVLPHGGPIGVRDLRHFDPLVQYLAAGRLAVLQVNYRGSGGRGGAFLDAARRQWGAGIEDDVEASVERVVALGWVDPERICIAGGSYGGYSALMSVIRYPERYRCSASLNGPTDLPFLYHSWPFMKHTKPGRDYFLEFIGDPDEDYEELLEISPAYRADEIRVPLLLVHGVRDERVRVDHFHRMRFALDAHGRAYESHLIQDGGHSLSTDQWVRFAMRLRHFVSRHLDTR